VPVAVTAPTTITAWAELSLLERPFSIQPEPLLLQTGKADMTDSIFLTLEEVVERYRGQISVGTFRNWRSMRIGPSFIKIGKAVLYPLEELNRWDRRNLVTCRSSRSLPIEEGGLAARMRLYGLSGVGWIRPVLKSIRNS
jgi:hypothetical protein